MSDYTPIRTEPNETERYINFLFNKIEYDKSKVRSNMYRIKPGYIYSIFSLKNNEYLKNRIKQSDQNYPNRSSTRKHSLISRNNSQKINLKLNQIKTSSFANNNNIEKTNTDNNLLKNKSLNIKKPHTKIYQKYLRIINGILDNELYNEKSENDKNNINKISNNKIKEYTIRTKDNHFNKRIRNHNKGKDKVNIINSICIGKSVINNCILRDKVIYDIKPLNKSEQKGRCFFPLKDTNNINDSSNNDNIEFKLLEKMPIIKSKNIIHKNKEKNNLNKTVKINWIKKINQIGQIPLNTLLYKEEDITENLKGPKLKTFYGRGSGDMVRGEKIKFLKTCSDVKLIKPLLTQKGYIFKSNIIPKKTIYNYNIKKKEFNDYDVVIKRNNKEIKKVKNKLKYIRRNIFNAFKWVEDRKMKLFDFKTEDDIYNL